MMRRTRSVCTAPSAPTSSDPTARTAIGPGGPGTRGGPRRFAMVRTAPARATSTRSERPPPPSGTKSRARSAQRASSARASRTSRRIAVTASLYLADLADHEARTLGGAAKCQMHLGFGREAIAEHPARRHGRRAALARARRGGGGGEALGRPVGEKRFEHHRELIRPVVSIAEPEIIGGDVNLDLPRQDRPQPGRIPAPEGGLDRRQGRPGRPAIGAPGGPAGGTKPGRGGRGGGRKDTKKRAPG